jgi:hypothetical protein
MLLYTTTASVPITGASLFFIIKNRVIQLTKKQTRQSSSHIERRKKINQLHYKISRSLALCEVPKRRSTDN